MRPEILYVLISQDQDPASQGVDAGKAIAAFCKRWKEGHVDRWCYMAELRYVSVLNQAELDKWHDKMHELKVSHDYAREANGEYRRSAIAALTDTDVFDELPVWDPYTQIVGSMSASELPFKYKNGVRIVEH